ncbi:HAD family hydrolase [Plantactinospora sp. CA-290183]|uniref:HAD family hydrolase n=1 Tax=Plantactinospora sp. CA-290183 TaxID=3240006 RepID=UPI003D8F5686
MTAGVHAVVFDLDGVLIDSITVMRQAFDLAYKEVVGKGEAPFEDYLPHLGRHMPETLRIMGLPADMYPAFVRHSHDLVGEVPQCAGAAALLAGLRARGPALAVATGKTHDRAVHVLAAVGLLDSLDVVVGSDEVPRGKPAPDIVLLALAQLGVDPAHAFMVGDSPLDLLAGRAAGTRVAAALWGQGAEADLLDCRPELTAVSCADLASRLHDLPLQAPPRSAR